MKAFCFPEKVMYRIILQKDICYFYDLNNSNPPRLLCMYVCVCLCLCVCICTWIYATIYAHIAYHSIYVEVRRQPM